MYFNADVHMLAVKEGTLQLLTGDDDDAGDEIS